MEKIPANPLLQQWGNALAFILLIMTFNYASITLRSKKGTLKEVRIFNATADAFPSLLPPLEMAVFKNSGITEQPKAKKL